MRADTWYHAKMICEDCNMSGHTITFDQLRVMWEIESSDQVFDDTGLGLAANVVKNGSGILLVEECADRVRIAVCLGVKCRKTPHVVDIYVGKIETCDTSWPSPVPPFSSLSLCIHPPPCLQ